MRQRIELLLLVLLLPFILGVAGADASWSADLVANDGPDAEINFVARALVRISGAWILPYFKALSLAIAAASAIFVTCVARKSPSGPRRAAALMAARLIVVAATTMSLFLLVWWGIYGAIARGWIA
jgi:hypothetical protein